jgi:hypothetical protein
MDARSHVFYDDSLAESAAVLAYIDLTPAPLQ